METAVEELPVNEERIALNTHAILLRDMLDCPYLPGAERLDIKRIRDRILNKLDSIE